MDIIGLLTIYIFFFILLASLYQSHSVPLALANENMILFLCLDR